MNTGAVVATCVCTLILGALVLLLLRSTGVAATTPTSDAWADAVAETLTALRVFKASSEIHDIESLPVDFVCQTDKRMDVTVCTNARPEGPSDPQTNPKDVKCLKLPFHGGAHMYVCAPTVSNVVLRGQVVAARLVRDAEAALANAAAANTRDR